MSNRYDALVIGTGTAGQTAAYELNRNGLRVAVVEHSERPGGTCALSGCQAKKWYYEGAETVARSHHLCGIGITAPASADWSDLRAAKNRFTARVPANTVSGLKQAGIELISGRARFLDHSTIAVDRQRLSARFVVIATGAIPMALPMEGAQWMVTSTEFLELNRLPRRIVFIGGGFISFELSHFAVRLGPTDTGCIILEAGPRPLGPFDEEMVALLAEASALEGIDIHSQAAVTAIEQRDGIFTVRTEDGSRYEADLVVHGAGRSPDIDDLDLEKAGIHYQRRGITVNDGMQTTQAGIYAVGDCAATVQLARVADLEAQTAAANIVNRYNNRDTRTTMDYSAVPAVLFTYPQYGMVGATEQALTKEGVAHQKSFGKDLNWPTYRRVGLKSAAYKILAGQDGAVLGAHILSDNATGLISLFTLAMRNQITVDKLYRQCIMTPYPSRESDIIYMLKPLL